MGAQPANRVLVAEINSEPRIILAVADTLSHLLQACTRSRSLKSAICLVLGLAFRVWGMGLRFRV